MNQARILFRLDDEEKLYTAREIMLKLGKINSHIYDSTKPIIIDGHRIKLVKRAVYDIYINKQLILEGVMDIKEALEQLGYNERYYSAKSQKGLYIRRRWLVYDGKERSEKVQSTLL